MSDEQTVQPEPEREVYSEPSEDWGDVLARARARALGVSLEEARLMGAQSLPEKEAELKRQERGFKATVQRILEKAQVTPETFERDAEIPPPPPPRSAVEVRLGWYIAPRHKDDTFDTYRPHTPSQRGALQAARAWAEATIRGEGVTLALIGNNGAGKSHLLYSAVRAVNEAGVHCAAFGWYDLANALREAKVYADTEEYHEAKERVRRLHAAKALAIDEIRPTAGTEFDGRELAQIMVNAYRNCQSVIVTSNYADEKLAAIIGLAAASRLTPVVVTGPDLRRPENRHLRAV